MKASELAILGLLVERPRHGYQLERVIEQRNMREWTEIGFSSIYAILSRLEEQSLIEHIVQPSRKQGPPRKVYSVTELGRSAWKEASLGLLSSPEGGQLSFLLGLTAMPALPRADLQDALHQHLDHLRQRLERVQDRYEQIGSEPPLHLQAIFEYSLTLLRAEINWTEDLMRRLINN